jgi:hypothetical protein
MKYVLSFMFLILSACSPKFKVGDCIRSQFDESWSTHQLDGKILEIGKYHYKIVYLQGGSPGDEFSDIGYVDGTKVKIDCPNK